MDGGLVVVDAARRSRASRAATGSGSRSSRRARARPAAGRARPRTAARSSDTGRRRRSSRPRCRAGRPRCRARRSPGSARPRGASKAMPVFETPPSTVASRAITPSASAFRRSSIRRPRGSFVASVATYSVAARRSDTTRVAWNHIPPASKPSGPVGPLPGPAASDRSVRPSRNSRCQGSGVTVARRAPDSTVAGAAPRAGATSASASSTTPQPVAHRRMAGRIGACVRRRADRACRPWAACPRASAAASCRAGSGRRKRGRS